MSLLLDLLDLTTAKKEINDKHTVGGIGAADVVSDFAGMYKKAQAISAKASKFILQYPVACSDSITNYKTGIAIAKQVEFDCARFYLLASGLDPVINVKNGGTIQAHLDKLTNATEAYVRNKFPGFSIKITQPTEDDIAHAMENLSIANEPFTIQSRESVLAKTVFSREDENEEVETLGVDDTFKEIDSDYEGEIDTEKPDESSKNGKGNNKEEKTTYEIRKDVRDFEKLGKSAPTVINIELILNDVGGQRIVKVPLAFKSDLQFCPHQDLIDLIGSSDTKANKFLKSWIKLTSGEIKFFKDWLFAIDEAKGDVDKEYAIGRVPILRHLMSAKNANRTKNAIDVWFKYFPRFKEKLKGLITDKSQKELPMVTVIVTEQDFETATGNSINKALQPNSKVIQTILDDYMLLGFGIIDELNDVGYFFYSGEEGFSTIELSKMGSNSNDKPVSEKLTEVLAAMSKMITRH